MLKDLLLIFYHHFIKFFLTRGYHEYDEQKKIIIYTKNLLKLN